MIAKTSFNTIADISTAAERIEDAHEQGYNDYVAAFDGGILPENPYPEGTEEYLAWKQGFWEARTAAVLDWMGR